MRETIRLLCEAVDDVVFPRHCLITGNYLGTTPTRLPGVSDAITDALPPGPPPLDVLALLQRNFDDDDLLLTHAFARYAVQIDSDADKLIYAIKYGQRKRLALALGREVGATLGELSNFRYDMVVPVPIHSARRRERGYNQAALIANGVAHALQTHYAENAHNAKSVLYAEPLTRIRYTGTQTTLDASHRLANVANAFELRRIMNLNGAHDMQGPHMLKGAHVLIVDDVLTTGATMNACAEVLLNSGARRVDAAAIAVAL